MLSILGLILGLAALVWLNKYLNWRDAAKRNSKIWDIKASFHRKARVQYYEAISLIDTRMAHWWSLLSESERETVRAVLFEADMRGWTYGQISHVVPVHNVNCL